MTNDLCFEFAQVATSEEVIRGKVVTDTLPMLMKGQLSVA
jgi:hypothetical protein